MQDGDGTHKRFQLPTSREPGATGCPGRGIYGNRCTMANFGTGPVGCSLGMSDATPAE
jgi:hypothetical protein